MTTKKIHVVVGIVTNKEGQLLVARRLERFQADYWEFPGGKVEPGETQLAALIRELKEEVNLEVISAVPFFKFDYESSHHLLELDIWRVTEFKGEAFGMEGQPIQWLFLKELHTLGMLPANERVLLALEAHHS